ncbi:hypothetical protein LCGC14_0838150 [marine sediment metagenome]|uniref:Uncharacterized protein n=1 Tax=marine sediment metagenome TaxID=412755 RepID=A0A0F9PZ80_9ZZZZ
MLIVGSSKGRLKWEGYAFERRNLLWSIEKFKHEMMFEPEEEE